MTAMAPDAPMIGPGDAGSVAHCTRKPATPRNGKVISISLQPNRRSRDRPNTHRNKQLPVTWNTSPWTKEAVTTAIVLVMLGIIGADYAFGLHAWLVRYLG